MTREEALKVLAGLEAVEKAASAGPWKRHSTILWSPEDRCTVAAMSDPKGGPLVQYYEVDLGSDGLEQAAANGDFIATARNALPVLLSIVRGVLELHEEQVMKEYDENEHELVSITCQKDMQYMPCETVNIVLSAMEKLEGRS